MWHLALVFAVLSAPPQDLAGESADSVGKISSIGTVEDTIASMRLELALQQFKKDKCWELGCLVIANESRSYDLIAFHIAERPDGPPKWGANRFSTPLAPMRATAGIKTGNAATCAMPVRFILRERKTRKKVTIDGIANLCSTPHQDSIVHVNVVEPKVSLEGPAGD